MRSASFIGCAVLAALPGVAAHGWVTAPLSKNEVAFHHWVEGIPEKGFHYEPQSSNYGNAGGQPLKFDGGASCGAVDAIYTEGLATWQKLYNLAKVDVPRLKPGEDVQFLSTLTIDHGGQAFVALTCDRTATENSTWTYMERAQSDRAEHFMPSTPTAFAWAPLEYHVKHADVMNMTFTVPQDFSCPSGNGIARWLWKTGNTCQDITGDLGRKSPPFTFKEYKAVVDAYDPGMYIGGACQTTPPEEFISCIDFVIGEPPPTPPTPPTPPPPTPPPVTCGSWTAACGSCKGKCVPCVSNPSEWQCSPAEYY